MVPLPPENIPPLDDPAFGNRPGPYSVSELRRVLGTRINPDSADYYGRRELLTSELCLPKTCAHPMLADWLSDVGGFDPRCRIKQPPLTDDGWKMTKLIPRVSVYGEKLVFPLQPGWYMVDYPTLNSNPAELPSRPWVGRLKERFPEGTDLLLSFYGNQQVKLGLWSLAEFYDAPFLDQFSGIVMPTFSSYSNDPLTQMMVGERMGEIFAQEGHDRGHNIIPTVAWTNEDSLRRQMQLWASNPNVNTVLFDCYGSGVNRTLWVWHWLFAFEKYCAPLRDMRWLVAGITSGWAIRELNRIFPGGNYCLVPSISTFVQATTKTTDREFMGKRYRQKLQKLEDFMDGSEIADAEPRPDRWPSFADALLPE